MRESTPSLVPSTYRVDAKEISFAETGLLSHTRATYPENSPRSMFCRCFGLLPAKSGHLLESLFLGSKPIPIPSISRATTAAFVSSGHGYHCVVQRPLRGSKKSPAAVERAGRDPEWFLVQSCTGTNRFTSCAWLRRSRRSLRKAIVSFVSQRGRRLA
jgi:hypothetical protein